MKKTICLLLSLVLSVCFCAPSFSETAGETVPELSTSAEIVSEAADKAASAPVTTPAPIPAEENKQETSGAENPEATQGSFSEIAEKPDTAPETSASPVQAQETVSSAEQPEEQIQEDFSAPGSENEVPSAESPEDGAAESSSTEEMEKTLPEETPGKLPDEGEIPETAAEDSVSKGSEEIPAGEAAGNEATEPGEDPAPVSQLSKAANLTLTSRELTSVTLTFSGDSAPTEYRVYRATEKKGKYKDIGAAWEPVGNSGEYRFDDLTAKKGTTYYYKVRGMISEAGETRWGAYSAVVSGTTKPASVGKITGKSLSAVSVKVSWNTVTGATGYQIGRSTKLDSGYKVLKTTKGTAVTYTDKTAKMGTQYYYRIRAYYTTSGGSKIYGPYTYSSTILCEPAPPADFLVSANTDTSVTLSWKPAVGVDYYSLVYSWKESGVTKKETIEGIAPGRKSFQIDGLYPGQALTFQIRSYGLTAGHDLMRSGIAECSFTIPAPESSEAPQNSGTENPRGIPAGDSSGPSETEQQEQTAEEPLLPGEDEGPVLEKDALETAPVITEITVTSAGVLLSWDETPGAETYRVERSAKHSSGYVTIAQGIPETSFLDTTAATAKAYYYRVVALDGAETELASEPKGIFVSAALTLTSKRGSDGYYTLTWASRKNADQYRIYRSVNGEGFRQVKTLGASSARSWKDKDIAAGNTYIYYVQAWKTADGEKVAGAKGTEKSIYVGVKENPAVTVTQAPSKITLSWDKVANASGYVIYGAKGDSALEVLARVSSSATSWSQNPPASSGYLKYYVRAYAVVGGKKNYAPDSDPVIIRRLAPPQIAIRRGEEENTLEVRWSAVTGAGNYRVYYKTSPEEDYRYAETTDRAMILPVQGGSTVFVYVRALCTEGEETFEGSRSAIKRLTPYWKYALLIGNSMYTTKSSLGRLAMCAADVEGLSVVLDRQHGWNINACSNMTGSEILAAISRFYNGANENCTCLFYYAGHGSMSNDEKTGSMYGVDGSYVTLGQLKAALNQVSGKTIVLLDSCGSGAAVENDSGAETLEEDKYSVITASKAYEKSFASLFYSYFTYYLSFGSGWDYNSKKDLATLPADTDKDGVISFQEICTYIARYLTVSTLTMKLPEPEAPIY